MTQVIQDLEKLKKRHTRLGKEYYMLCQENITIDKCIRVVRKNLKRQRVSIEHN